MKFVVTDLIRKKRFGSPLQDQELKFLVENYVNGDIPDYQMSAFLMAVCFRGMTAEETASYTQFLKNSGSTLSFEAHHPHVVDKHSTGGVGDKTSLMLAPIVAETGVRVPMIAGRGLGHTGGTLDKLESIPGFSVKLTLTEFQKNLETRGFSIIGQTNEICPADKKLYALRDVTGTIDSLPLICGSIMSKKLAEGLSALVLDVKFGSGAFMKTEREAIELAQLLKTTGDRNGVDVHVLITSMEEPLGCFIGNSLEVFECLEILQGKQRIIDGEDFYSDTKELTLKLAGEMIYAGKKADNPEAGYKMAQEILSSGAALKNFKNMVEFQGGGLEKAFLGCKQVYEVPALQSGFVTKMNVEALGMASLLLGAGRQKASDVIDPHVGMEMQTRIAMPVKKGSPLCLIHSNGHEEKEILTQKIQQAVSIGNQNPGAPRLIRKTLR